MKAKELKEYILQNDRLEDILYEIGCHDIKKYSGYWQFGLSESSGHDSKTSTVIKFPYLSVQAYTIKLESKFEGGTPDIFDLIEHETSVNGLQWAHNFLGLSSNTSYKTSSSIIDMYDLGMYIKASNKIKSYNKEEKKTYSLSTLDRYDKQFHSQLFEKDSLLSSVLEKHNVRFDSQSDRIIFPHLDPYDKTKVLACVGRTIFPNYDDLKIPKYMTVLGVGYAKANNLYGLSLYREEIIKHKKIILVEAEKSVMKLDMYGYPFAVSVGCHSISEEQIRLILELGIQEIIIAWDKETEGDEAITEESLIEECKIFSPYMNASYIYDSHGILKNKSAPVDEGIKKWNYLYKYRKFVD